MNPKIEEINVTIKALEESADNLRKRRAELQHEDDVYRSLAKDGKKLPDDATEGQVNYALGRSCGRIDGLREAVSLLTISLASVYDEDARGQIMYALADLGETIARARMKYEKDIEVLEKSGWKMDGTKSMRWVKEDDTGADAGRTDSD